MTEIGLETHYVLYCRVSVVKDVHEKCQQDGKRYETKKTISQPLFLESVLLYFVFFKYFVSYGRANQMTGFNTMKTLVFNWLTRDIKEGSHLALFLMSILFEQKY